MVKAFLYTTLSLIVITTDATPGLTTFLPTLPGLPLMKTNGLIPIATTVRIRRLTVTFRVVFTAVLVVAGFGVGFFTVGFFTVGFGVGLVAGLAVGVEVGIGVGLAVGDGVGVGVGAGLTVKVV